MALEGTLQDFSLADIFQLIGLQRKTGLLTLTGKEDTVSILFEAGRIVGAESEVKHLEDRLGHVLVKTHKLPPATLSRFLRMQKETGQRLGTILLRQKAITLEDLTRALQLQVTTILFRLFRWSDGHYHFSQSEQVDFERECFEPIPVEDILMEGLRILDEWPLIEKRVPSFEQIFQQADSARLVQSEERSGQEKSLDLALEPQPGELADPAAIDGTTPRTGVETVTVSPAEEVVYRLVNARYEVQDIIDRSDLGDFETCKALFHLLEKDLILPVEAIVGARADGPGHLSGWSDRAMAVAMALLLVGGTVLSIWINATPHKNGTGTWHRAMLPFRPATDLARLQLMTSQNQLSRLEYAVRLFALHRGYYPDSLLDMVSMGVVAAADLRDPWGRDYVYVLSRRNFQIRGVDDAGNPHPALILTGATRPGMPGPRVQSRLEP